MDEILYIRLIDGTIIPYDKFEGEIPSDAKVGKIHELLQIGDLVKIEYCPVYGDERKTVLFIVDNIMWDGNFINVSSPGMTFQIIDGEFNCEKGIFANVKPVILSVLTKEQLESIEFIVDKPRNQVK